MFAWLQKAKDSPSPCPWQMSPPACATSFVWCFPFQKGYFVTMKVLYTCGYSTSLAALFLAIGIFSCFR